jgi:hypothetical protein
MARSCDQALHDRDGSRKTVAELPYGLLTVASPDAQLTVVIRES